MALQCNIGDLQIAVCMLHYALLHHRNCALPFALASYIIHTSAHNWWFAICALQVTCQCTALQHWWPIWTVQIISKGVQCSTGHLQFVVCHLCYVAQQCRCGEFHFALYKILHVGTALRNQRNTICTLPVYYVILQCSISDL